MPELISAVNSGDRRASLEALRETLALAIIEAQPRELAPLAKQLTDVMRELESLPLAKEESRVDDLASRRRARRSAASSGEPADGEDVRGS